MFADCLVQNKNKMHLKCDSLSKERENAFGKLFAKIYRATGSSTAGYRFNNTTHSYRLNITQHWSAGTPAAD